MWRSIATRSGHAIRRLGTTNNYKVPSSKTASLPHSRKNPPLNTCILSKPSHLYRHHRFLSDASANPADDRSISTESERSSLGFEQNGVTQVGASTSASGDSGTFDLSSEDFCENNDTQLENFAYGNVIPEIAERSSIDCGGIDLDLLHGIADHTSVGFDGDGDMQAEVAAYEIDVEKLGNVLSLLQSSVDGSLESSLNGMDLYLHEKFVVKVLETPLLLGENVIRFFKWAMKKPEFKVTSCVVDFLVQAICSDLRMKDSYALWDLVKEIGEKGSGALNVEILNKLISLFSRLGKGKAALEVFNKFEDFGCVHDEETYYFTIEALCRRSFFDWALSVCEKMLDAGALPDSEKVGKIISWFCKGGKAENAHLVYMLEREKNKYPPQSSINYLISSLCQKDETVKLALDMLNDFSGEARKYAIKPFSSVIHGLCKIKDVDGAKNLLGIMIAEGPPPGNEVFNRIITGYSKSGDMKEAMEMIKLMESRNLKPDVYTYTVVISGYANGGQMEEAIKVLSEAKNKHTKLSPATYHTLIRGYCKLEEFDSALKLMSEMKDFGVQPKVDEYNKLIQSLCLKALDWGAAEKLFEEMKESGLHLSGITKGLIRAVKELEEEETLANEEVSRTLSD